MKTIFFWLSLCLVITQSQSAIPRTTAGASDEPSGIKFFTGSWKAVLAEAKRQNKPVFVDIYTTWCGPCKMMAKEAFPDAKVGGKFNANFVSYQIDAEKGEGVAVAKQYDVHAYPTSLYVDANGDLIHRSAGYGGIQEMLEQADEAIKKATETAKDPNTLSAMELEQQYKSGKRDANFLATYLAKRGQVGAPDGEALNAYLNVISESEWSSEKNLKLISGNLTTANSKGFEILRRKLPADALTSNNEWFGLKGLHNALENDFKQAVTQNDENQLAEYIRRSEQLMDFLRPQDELSKLQLANFHRTRFYQETKNMANYPKNTDKYRALASAEANKLLAIPMDSIQMKDKAIFKDFESRSVAVADSVRNSDEYKQFLAQMQKRESNQVAMKLNNIAWAYYENMIDPKDLNQALTWSAKSLEYDRSGMYLDTYAHLLSKLGRKPEAVKAQEEAIAKTKAAGQDTADYEKGLTEIKKK